MGLNRRTFAKQTGLATTVLAAPATGNRSQGPGPVTVIESSTRWRGVAPR